MTKGDAEVTGLMVLDSRLRGNDGIKRCRNDERSVGATKQGDAEMTKSAGNI